MNEPTKLFLYILVPILVFAYYRTLLEETRSFRKTIEQQNQTIINLMREKKIEKY